MLASVSDDRNWRLIVDKAGVAYLLDVSANETPFDQLHCYFETWCHGNDYVGPAAAASEKWVHLVAVDLRRNWPNLEHGAFIDH